MRAKYARQIRAGIELARRPWRLIGSFPGGPGSIPALTMRAYRRTRERNLNDWYGKGGRS